MKGAGFVTSQLLKFFSCQKIVGFPLKMHVRSQYNSLNPTHPIILIWIFCTGNDKFCHFYFSEISMNYGQRDWIKKSDGIIMNREYGAKVGMNLTTHCQQDNI
jgi:hypothetical protein